MRRIIILTILALTAIVARPQKQKKASNKAAVSNIELAKQAISNYDFSLAEDILTKELTALKKKKLPTAEAENLIHAARQGRIKLQATERIVIIDSIVCKESEVLKSIRLSPENGRIDTYASTYHTSDERGATLYENDFANKRYLAIPNPEDASKLSLAVSDKIGELWSELTLLKGLNDDASQNFPFLLSDGVTLYYAATGRESMGKYDIFVSRADGEDGSFLTPENVGYPYNSSANDYLLLIDEFNHLGWFVTDRRQEKGEVCIYIFIPNETRELFDEDISEQELGAYAKINCIKDTWKFADENELEAARKRWNNLLSNNRRQNVQASDFTFIVDDTRTYYTLSDFKSSRARNLMKEWITLSKTNTTDRTMLSRLRDNYSTSSESQKEQLHKTILDIERNVESQEKQIHILSKQIREAEIYNQ